MQLLSPFIISARLAPALSVGGATLSFNSNNFIIDLPNGEEHVITDFHFAPGCRGDSAGKRLQDGFASILSFLSACAESRQYAVRNGKSPMEGENSDLFPENVGQWAEENSDEIAMLSFELEESGQEFIII